MFNDGVDEALNGTGPFGDFAYFCKNQSYARYNWRNDVVDLVDQPLAAWKLPNEFLTGVDAVLAGEGKFAGMAYFFKGAQYVRYSWADDRTEGPFDIAPAWHLPGDFNTDIDAAVNGRADFSGRAYFFKGADYVRYDWAVDGPAAGYPHRIRGDWRHGYAVWANLDTALNVDRDARLHDDNGDLVRLPYPQGIPRGQAGWDVGLQFGSPHGLATSLRFRPVTLPNFICGNLVNDCGPLRDRTPHRMPSRQEPRRHCPAHSPLTGDARSESRRLHHGRFLARGPTTSTRRIAGPYRHDGAGNA